MAGTQGIGVFGINSKFASGSLVFYEKAVGRTDTGDVFTVGTAAVKVGGTSQDVDFQVYGTGSLSAIIDIGAATFTMVGLTSSTDKPLTISDATESTSTTTGALIVSGGIGFAKDMYVGDDVFLTSAAKLDWNAGDVTLTHSAGKLALGGDGAVELDLDDANMDVALPAGCVDKADLASEVYTIEHFTLEGNTNDFDNETIKLSRLWSAGTVVRVVYFTNAAIGTNLGIDILDGGTDGTGTDVIDSCADNLSGVDVNTMTTPYALSADDYINVKFDDLTNDVSFTIDIQVKVPVVTAT